MLLLLQTLYSTSLFRSVILVRTKAYVQRNSQTESIPIVHSIVKPAIYFGIEIQVRVKLSMTHHFPSGRVKEDYPPSNEKSL